MPRLSDTMEEGTILRWLKADGEEVARGEELVEIETDKATMVYESDQAGTLDADRGRGRHAAGRGDDRTGRAPAGRTARAEAVGSRPSPAGGEPGACARARNRRRPARSRPRRRAATAASA